MSLKRPGVEPIFSEKAASCERLRNFAYPIAFAIAFGSAYHRRPKGSASPNQIDAAMILTGTDFVNMLWRNRLVRCRLIPV
jgi:hypothetical protein